MKFSVCVMANIDEIGFFSHLETLGYHAAWVTDSQMLFSDCYAVLALAAQQTSRLHLGPGTAITGTRIPPGCQPVQRRCSGGTRAHSHRHRHRQHGHAHHGPAPDEDR